MSDEKVQPNNAGQKVKRCRCFSVMRRHLTWLICAWDICKCPNVILHYNDIIMSAIASQITSLMIVYSIVFPCADQRKHQSSSSLAFVTGIHRLPVNSPYKGPITWQMFSFDDVIMDEYKTRLDEPLGVWWHGLGLRRCRNPHWSMSAKGSFDSRGVIA